MKILLAILLIGFTLCAKAQPVRMAVLVGEADQRLPGKLEYETHTYTIGADGRFTVPPAGQRFVIQAAGYHAVDTVLGEGANLTMLALRPLELTVAEVVVVDKAPPASGRVHGPESRERLSPAFFNQITTPSLTDQLNRVTGLASRPTCAVCGAAELRLLGLEGPYTLVMIDSVPIVGSLAGIYGLQGLPTLMARGVDVMRGLPGAALPAEAMGGVVNVLTRTPGQTRPEFRVQGGSLGEAALDVHVPLSQRFSLSGQGYVLDRPSDLNGDEYLDIPRSRRASMATSGVLPVGGLGRLRLYARGYGERRMGGQVGYRPEFRHTDSVYGEDITTYRAELASVMHWRNAWAGQTQLGAAHHDQNAAYGTTLYLGRQTDVWLQHSWRYRAGIHALEGGLALRTQRYDDNSPGTPQAELYITPGAYVQDEIALSERLLLRPGIRLERHPVHGVVASPRLHGQFEVAHWLHLRAGTGRAFRTVSVFTEDHAALTGARRVVLAEALRPEEAWTSLAEATAHADLPYDWHLEFTVTGWHARFANKIIPDYDSDPNAIFYRNLAGVAVNQGVLGQVSAQREGVVLTAGGSVMDYYRQAAESGRQAVLLSPAYTANGDVSYPLKRWKATVSASVQTTGPMVMPLQPNDSRPRRSPANTQVACQWSQQVGKGLTATLAVRNLLDAYQRIAPISRPQDPFDKRLGVDNPGGQTFDPSYVYAPLTGRRFSLALTWQL